MQFFSKKQKSYNFQSQQRLFYCKKGYKCKWLIWADELWRLNEIAFVDFFHFRIFKLVFVVIFIARTHRPKQIETILVQHNQT